MKVNDVVNQCVELSLKNKGREEVFFMGETVEGKPIYQSIMDIKHLMIIGGSGSGKTSNVTALLSIWSEVSSRLEGDVKVYVADGKNSPDMNGLAQRYSEFEVAGTLHHPINELNNLLVEVWCEYKRRQRVFNECGTRDIYKYRELGNKLPRIFLVIDEFAVFKASMGEISVQATIGSTEQMILDLARQARSYGITLVLMGQSPKHETFPNILKENLSTKIFHKLDPRMSSYCREWCNDNNPSDLKKGQFILTMDSVYGTEVVCKSNMIGKSNDKFDINERTFSEDENFEFYTSIKSKEKKTFDLDILMNNAVDDKDIFSQRASLTTIATFFKKRILDAEGFESLETFNLKIVESKIFGAICIKDNKKIVFGFVEQSRLTPNMFLLAEFQRIEDEHKPDMYVFFCNKIRERELKDIKNVYGQDIKFKKSHFLERAAYIPLIVESEMEFVEQSMKHDKMESILQDIQARVYQF